MEGCRKIFCLIALLIIQCGLVFGETERYKFRHIRANEGLPAPSVYSVVKDNQGFIWLATGIGLYRYDGKNFTVYRSIPDDTATLSSNLITSHLFIDKAGDLWAGTADNGLNRVNLSTGSITRYTHDPQNPRSISHRHVHKIMQDGSGIIWIATSGGGLNKFNDESGDFKVYSPVPDEPSRNSNYIQSFVESDNHTLLVGTRRGLYIFDKTDGSFTCFSSEETEDGFLRKEVIVTIIKDNDILWIGTENGLVRYNTGTRDITRYQSATNDQTTLSSNIITHITDSPDKRSLWISTVWGLNRFDKVTGRTERFLYSSKDPKSLGYNMVWNMFADSSNLLWIGTDNAGLNMLNLNANPFRHQKIEGERAGEGQFSATAFCEDNNGDLWIGTFEGGLWQYDRDMMFRNRYISHPDDLNSLTGNTVFSLCTDSENRLWVGTSGGGVNRLSGNTTARFHTDPVIPRPQLSSVIKIVADNEDRIWIGSLNGLYYLDEMPGGEIMNIDFEPLGDALIRAICEDRNGNLWIGTQGRGLFKLAKKEGGTFKFQNYLNIPGDRNSISCNIVMSVYEDHSGDIWIATIQGLNRYQPGEDNFITYDSSNGLDADYLYDIQGEEAGILWITSSRGLIRFDPQAGYDQLSKLYDFQSDVPSEDIYPFSFYLSKEGKVYIGGKYGSDYGYYTFSIDSLKDNTLIPSVVITSILVGDEPLKTDSLVSAKKHLVLKHNQNFLSFEFAALDYTDPKKNHYAYYLEGFDGDWNFSGNRTFTKYTGLPTGNYVFRVKGSNNDGYWNEAGASLAVTILAPPWKTWWSYLIYSMLFAGLFLAWRRYDLKRQNLKQELYLEHVEAEKLKELDSIKSRFFANISHEFRTPLTLVLGQIERLRSFIKDEGLSRDLNMMHRNAKRLHNLINQLLSLSKLDAGLMKLHAREENIVSLVNGYLQTFESLARKRKIDLLFRSSGESIQLFADRDKIEKILYNLLSNAFKFTGEGGRIEVEVAAPSLSPEGGARMTLITISDNGCGIPPEKLPYIFDRFYQGDYSSLTENEGTGIGLSLAKELVELHHGTITVKSRVGGGTTFSVFLPEGKDHLDPDEIADDTGFSGSEDILIETVTEPVYPESDPAIEGAADGNEVEAKKEKPCLLIVEDNADLRTYMRGYLNMNYHILEAGHGEEGFDAAAEKIPDLIVSDVMMPGMDGYQLCRKLKSDERTSHIPVILLTARAATEDRLEGLETGADDFLTKPFNRQELLVRIRNLINQREKLREKYKNLYILKGGKRQEETLSTDDRFLQKALNFITQNLSDPGLDIERFSQHMAMSRSQLYRKLKALVDLSPNEMIRSLRLQRAAELIVQNSGTISEIAYAVGFNNPSYFSECFRRHFGRLPSEYTG